VAEALAMPADRRIVRTQRMLREALIASILERGWERTSVQQVCARADVGRSTFYAHFADKEELLLSGLDDLHVKLRECVRADAGRRTVLRFARPLMQHAEGHRGLHRALKGLRTGHLVEERIRRLVSDLVRDELAPLSSPGPMLEAAVSYVSGGFFQLFTGWMESRAPPAIPEVEERGRILTLSVVRTLRGSESDVLLPR
jgi:AcrR family transcriptional regulator